MSIIVPIYCVCVWVFSFICVHNMTISFEKCIKILFKEILNITWLVYAKINEKLKQIAPSHISSTCHLKPNLYRRTKLVQSNWISLLTVDFGVVCGSPCLHFVGLRYIFFFFFTTKQTIKNIFTVFSGLPKMFAS